MEKILSQEEIDQLFRAAQGAAPSAAASLQRVVQNCDFREAGQLTKDQVRQVTLLHENFAPNLANSLGAYLRVAFEISLVSVEQIGYKDFLSRIPEQTYFSTALLMPLEEVAAIQLDLPVTYPMIDLLLGGPGQSLAEPRDLTEIEEQILESVVALLCRELQSTWQLILPVEFTVGQRLKHGQIMSLMPAGERALNLSFEIRLNDTRGALNLVFPAVASNTVLRKLAQQGAASRRKPSATDSARLRERMQEALLTVELDLENVPVRVRDFVNLQAGEILPLGHALHESMFLTVNGHKVFGGTPVGCGPLRGALVRQVLPPLELTERERS
ncbi:MAG: FliM/FliN family flagellar motor switch protein [Acidobacteriia bacterium]|nr:FliM/FliN family flagellar motor switch protein [Terriglobia bacterium]